MSLKRTDGVKLFGSSGASKSDSPWEEEEFVRIY